MRAVNLLPSDLRGAPQGPAAPSSRVVEAGGPAPFAVLGVLALCVVALAMYVMTTNTVKDRQAKLADVTAQSESVAKQAAALKPYADFKALAEARISTVRDLAASRFDWERSLQGISRAIPADVTLKSLDGTISSQSGGASSAIRSEIGAPAIELQGCVPGQRAVARLMARLRNVEGVTRVSLSKSIRPDTATVATSGDLTGATVDVCGLGRPPAFDVVMFFEKSKVASSVQALALTAAPAAAPAGGEAAPAANGQSGPDATATGQATPTPAAGGEPAPVSTTTGAGTP
jgi:Tfp pilus assembly protein PilN